MPYSLRSSTQSSTTLIYKPYTYSPLPCKPPKFVTKSHLWNTLRNIAKKGSKYIPVPIINVYYFTATFMIIIHVSFLPKITINWSFDSTYDEFL